MPSASYPDRPLTPLSTSGIQILPTGESIIPSSVRDDGSTRKEIKVRPGYRPPEDWEVYRNPNVEALENIVKGGIPGAEPASTPLKKNKNAKRREAAARKKAAAAENHVQEVSVANITHELEQAEVPLSQTNKLDQDRRDPEEPSANQGVIAAVLEKERQVRNLKEKLRQARELREKKDEGGELLPEQLAKVMKIQELIKDLDKLGFGADGEPKARDLEAQGISSNGQG